MICHSLATCILNKPIRKILDLLKPELICDRSTLCREHIRTLLGALIQPYGYNAMQKTKILSG